MTEKIRSAQNVMDVSFFCRAGRMQHVGTAIQAEAIASMEALHAAT